MKNLVKPLLFNIFYDIVSVSILNKGLVLSTRRDEDLRPEPQDKLIATGVTRSKKEEWEAYCKRIDVKSARLLRHLIDEELKRGAKK